MGVGDWVKFLAERTRFMEASEIRELLKIIESRRVISFAGGLPDPSVFPKKELSDIAVKYFRSMVMKHYSIALQKVLHLLGGNYSGSWRGRVLGC